jgi:hypothetical protein
MRLRNKVNFRHNLEAAEICLNWKASKGSGNSASHGGQRINILINLRKVQNKNYFKNIGRFKIMSNCTGNGFVQYFWFAIYNSFNNKKKSEKISAEFLLTAFLWTKVGLLYSMVRAGAALKFDSPRSLSLDNVVNNPNHHTMKRLLFLQIL